VVESECVLREKNDMINGLLARQDLGVRCFPRDTIEFGKIIHFEKPDRFRHDFRVSPKPGIAYHIFRLFGVFRPVPGVRNLIMVCDQIAKISNLRGDRIELDPMSLVFFDIDIESRISEKRERS